MGGLEKLIEKYRGSCLKVLNELKLKDIPAMVTENHVRELIGHAKNYIKDAEFYATDNRPVALASISYAEGILDALKLLGIADFEW